jgi:hypothetical protein
VGWENPDHDGSARPLLQGPLHIISYCNGFQFLFNLNIQLESAPSFQKPKKQHPNTPTAIPYRIPIFLLRFGSGSEGL